MYSLKYLLVLLMVAASVSRAFAQSIDSFDPGYGSPGDSVLIYGSGFWPGTLTVKFNGIVDTTARATSPGVINARVPAGATTGPITVQVGSATVSSAAFFFIIGQGPFITLFYPAYGAVNDPITITGAHLTNPNGTAPMVKFGGVASASVAANSLGTQLTARVPAGATNGPITVITTLGSSNTVDSFEVIGPGPYVTGFSPIKGGVGTTIQIDGVHFLNTTNVVVGGKTGLNLFVQSETRIQVDVPPGVVSGPITVKSKAGSYTTSGLFYVPPGISGFTPSSGRAGTNVTLRGTNFLGAYSVLFGGVSASFVTPTNNTNLIVTVPAQAASGPIAVIAPAGSFTTTTNFSVQPSISGFTPIAGTAGQSVAIQGANLQQGLTSLTFGGITAQVTNATYGQLTAKVPTNAVSGPLTVTTTNGTFTTTSNFYAVSLITNVAPAGGPVGSIVTLSGRNLLGTTNVSFGVPSESFEVVDNWRVTAVVPTGALSGPVSISTPAGTFVSTNLFYGTPVITGFSPAEGLPGTNVVISGTNLLGATLVSFGGVPATSFKATNNYVLQATVPASAVSGPITVGTPGGTNSSSETFVLAYSSDLSVIGDGQPDPVPPGDVLRYMIKLTNVGPTQEPAARVDLSGIEMATLQSISAPSGTFVTNNTSLAWEIGPMASGSSLTAQVEVRPLQPGTLTVIATASGEHRDPKSSNNAATVTTTVLDVPALRIGRKTQALLEVSWPVAYTNYQLESRNALGTSGVWSNVTTLPSQSGTQQVVTVTNSGSSRFFRLRR